MLGVLSATLDAHGAVSEEVTREMATGALRAAKATVAVAISGIAGPGGGSAEKPVGLVYTGISLNGRTRVVRQIHFGDRRCVRDRAAKTALDVLRRQLGLVRE